MLIVAIWHNKKYGLLGEGKI